MPTIEDINRKLAPGWVCTQVILVTPEVVRLQLAQSADGDTSWIDGWCYWVQSPTLDDAVRQAEELTSQYTPAQLRARQRLQRDLAEILQQHTVAEWLQALESFSEQIVNDAESQALTDLRRQWRGLQERLTLARLQAARMNV